MIRRIAGAINDAQSGIDEFVVIEVKTPSKIGNQNKKKH
jgi:hypothetical protein